MRPTKVGLDRFQVDVKMKQKGNLLNMEALALALENHLLVPFSKFKEKGPIFSKSSLVFAWRLLFSLSF